MNSTRNSLGDPFEGIDDITAHTDLNRDILVDFGKIEVEMNNFGVFGVSGLFAGCTVGKPNTDGKNHIRFVLRHGGRIVSVHSLHT